MTAVLLTKTTTYARQEATALTKGKRNNQFCALLELTATQQEPRKLKTAGLALLEHSAIKVQVTRRFVNQAISVQQDLRKKRLVNQGHIVRQAVHRPSTAQLVSIVRPIAPTNTRSAAMEPTVLPHQSRQRTVLPARSAQVGLTTTTQTQLAQLAVSASIPPRVLISAMTAGQVTCVSEEPPSRTQLTFKLTVDLSVHPASTARWVLTQLSPALLRHSIRVQVLDS
jgi:hypothetical protein